MQNFQDTFETRKRRFTIGFSIFMNVPLSRMYLSVLIKVI